MGKRLKNVAVGIVTLVVLFGLMAPIQAVPYGVYGQVFDTNGIDPVDGVSVTVTCVETSESVSTTTASGGWYTVTLGNEPFAAPLAGDTLQISADAGDGRTNMTEVTATGNAPQGPVNLILVEDTMAPVTTITDITPEPTKYGWNNATPVTVSFSRTDPNSTGVDYTKYSTTSDVGPWTTVDGEDPFDVVINTEGTTTIWYYSVDNAGNIEVTKSVDVKIDLTAPTVIFIDPTPANESVNTTGYVNVTVEVTDPSPGSELEDIVYLSVWNETGLYRVINESAGGYQGFAVLYIFAEHGYYYNLSAPDGSPLPDGEYTYQAFAKDLAGNTGSSETRVVTVMKGAPVTEYNFTLDFVVGYNLIDVPLNDTSVTKASELATTIGGDVTQLSKWDAGSQKYVSHIPPVPVNDFAIVGGEGYFVIMTDSETVTFRGEGWESPFTLPLVTGYNMIGIPLNDTSVTKASELATTIGGDVTQLSKWDAGSQKYVSHIPPVPVNDFAIVGGEGYFVIMTGPATVVLEGDAWSD